ncbi:MAG: hypothetical protein JWN94_1131 [Betaproteobacteria bacterium]|nr:hypothetical protein [Betaproteobacteria bacterium]
MFPTSLCRVLLGGLIYLAASMQAHAQFEQPIIFFASTSLTASPATIEAGDSATLSFTGGIVHGGCDICISSSAQGDRGLVTGPSSVQAILFTISSGDGDSVSGQGSSGSATFTYENPGVYHPSVSGSLLYTRPFVFTRLSTGAVISSGVDSLIGGFSPSTTTITVLSVPEPETYSMLMAGFALLAFLKRRRGHVNPAAASEGRAHA